MSYLLHLTLLALVIAEDGRRVALCLAASLNGGGKPGGTELHVAPLVYYAYEFVALLIHT